MLKSALETAIEAALSVGDLLRADFHRAEDDRATHDAEVDAETAIKARLEAVQPDWGFIGEETEKRKPRNGARHVWLVDPLDGTSDHRVGARGGAVSIAAVAEGEPVLGVVYAYAAPDDRGDLFAWAAGCGPVTRNGRPLEAHALPARLRAEDVVLVSWKARRKVESNLRAVSPARFRAVPSIAYRLALLAAGEGSAVVSLNGACAWDFAGGHALLHGAGGVLVDDRGQPVRYEPDGWAHPPACFGGHRHVARHLAKAPWNDVLNAPRHEVLCATQRGNGIREAGILARAQGCLLGQLAGDNLGGLVEFESPVSIRGSHPHGVRDLVDGGTWNLLAGQATDDSELALALARTLVASGRHDLEQVARAYVRWLHSPPFDLGGTCGQAMRGGARGLPYEVADSMRAAANRDSKSNGSLMRISPLGVFGHALPAATLAEMARQESLLTHPNPACQDACAAFTLAVAHAVHTGDDRRAIYEAAMTWADAHAGDEVRGWLREAEHTVSDDFCHHMGFVRHALQNAFHQLLHAPTLEDGVVATVARGGDTDTNAAIAGALLGATFGRDAVPPSWQRMVLSCHAAPGTRRARPAEYWPSDVLVLAERLLRAGETASQGH